MTYAEELIKEGELKGRQEGERKGLQEGERRGRGRGRREGRQAGRLEGQLGTIADLVKAGVQWSVIEAAIDIDRDALRALKRRLEAPEDAAEDSD